MVLQCPIFVNIHTVENLNAGGVGGKKHVSRVWALSLVVQLFQIDWLFGAQFFVIKSQKDHMKKKPSKTNADKIELTSESEKPGQLQ